MTVITVEGMTSPTVCEQNIGAERKDILDIQGMEELGSNLLQDQKMLHGRLEAKWN